MAPNRIIIAIDGYSACGKSTTAKEAARILGYKYIDSGAMYRAATLYFLDHRISLTDSPSVANALANIRLTLEVNKEAKTETVLNGVNVEKEIRGMRISEQVSRVSAIPEVRYDMVERQRALGRAKGVVMDGRDIGTAVFPDAELKFFMTADIRVRALRRQQELLEKGTTITLSEIVHNLEERDRIDTGRSVSPLRKAIDAIELDTTYLTIDEQVDEVVRRALRLIISEPY